MYNDVKTFYMTKDERWWMMNRNDEGWKMLNDYDVKMMCCLCVFLNYVWWVFMHHIIFHNDEWRNVCFNNTSLNYIIMTIGSGTGMHVGLGMKYVAYRSWIRRTSICANDVNWCEDVCIMMYVFYDSITWTV